MATAATLNADVDAARAAMLNLDWQGALNLLMPIKLQLATRPDTMVGGQSGLRYNADAIDDLIDRCNQMIAQAAAASRAASGTSPFVQIPIQYERG